MIPHKLYIERNALIAARNAIFYALHFNRPPRDTIEKARQHTEKYHLAPGDDFERAALDHLESALQSPGAFNQFLLVYILPLYGKITLRECRKLEFETDMKPAEIIKAVKGLM